MRRACSSVSSGRGIGPFFLKSSLIYARNSSSDILLRFFFFGVLIFCLLSPVRGDVDSALRISRQLVFIQRTEFIKFLSGHQNFIHMGGWNSLVILGNTTMRICWSRNGHDPRLFALSTPAEKSINFLNNVTEITRLNPQFFATDGFAFLRLFGLLKFLVADAAMMTSDFFHRPPPPAERTTYAFRIAT